MPAARVASSPARHHGPALLQRIRGEYLEMPGLTLTSRQAQRLWGLDQAQCDALLAALVDTGFLARTRDGYRRR